jgi:hypothetical protein
MMVQFTRLHLIRTIVITVLILFFLPWWTDDYSRPISGISIIMRTIAFVEQYGMIEQPIVVIALWALIPINSILVLWVSFYRHNNLSAICMFAGFMELVPFVLVAIFSQADDTVWYPAPLFTMFCLIALIAIGVSLRWKPINAPRRFLG